MHKPVLVTGASSGIGEAVAVHLAHKGFKVFAAARRLEKLKVISGLGQGRITPLALDVTDNASIEAAMAEIAHSGQSLFGLVNNAGVSVVGPVEQTPLDEWRRLYETNILGVVAMTQAVLPQMRVAGVGRIINIGSVAGRIVAPFFGPYASSKHAVEGISDGLRREVKKHGIKVSLIRPGFINTPFGEQEQAALSAYEGTDQPYSSQMEIFKAWHAKGHPDAPSPMIVAEKVHHALTAERPHSRYTVPSKYIGSLMLRNLLPSAVVDRVFERIIGLDKLED